MPRLGDVNCASLCVSLLFVYGCALSPESKLQNEIISEVYWEAARGCPYIDRIAINGDLTLRVDSGRTTDVPWFIKCYRQGIASRVEARRKAGLPVPDSVNLTPEVDVDAD
jgi:hypothetical protein